MRKMLNKYKVLTPVQAVLPLMCVRFQSRLTINRVHSSGTIEFRTGFRLPDMARHHFNLWHPVNHTLHPN